MEPKQGDQITFTNDGEEILEGTINGKKNEDYVPVWVPAKSNTIFVHESNILTVLASK